MKKLIYFILILILPSFVISCNKEENPNEITVTDIDGNIYHTVTIGTQAWMLENLKTTRYRNGDPIPNVTDNTDWASLENGAYCDYVNSEYNGNKYGHLYNWHAITDNRNIAPTGWHVASDDEWKHLERSLGMTQVEVNKIGWRGTDQAAQLKATSGWYSGVGTNTSGFKAIPGEHREGDGSFVVGGYGYWWSSTEYNSGYALGRCLYVHMQTVQRDKFSKKVGFSVRCVRDY